MKADDLLAFGRMLALLAEQYGKALSPELMRLYFDGLSHLELQEVRAALNRHVRNTDVGQFMPKIADVIRALDGTSEDAAYGALVKLQETFGALGAYESPTFDDPIIACVVEGMGGWPELCARQAEEWQKFGAPEFMRRYRSIAARGLPVEAPRLLGIFERMNAAFGHVEHAAALRAEPPMALMGRSKGRKAAA